MSYIMDLSDERLKELMRSLADTIGAVVNENEDVRNTLAIMQQEGYPVEMIVTSITMMTAKKEDESFDADEKLSYYDRSFLKNVHVRLGDKQ